MSRFLSILMLISGMLAFAENIHADETKIPVIYCSDLFHPHDDPDDHFDLACIYAIHELELKSIILGQGLKQAKKPGRIPVEQLNYMTGRNVPWAIGLSQALKSPDDTGLDEPEKFQLGVSLIVKVLEESPVPVTIITVGSMRDVAATFNRRPKLFREKVSRIYAFIGDASGAFREYNVTLDPKAYQRMMNAGLPLYWVPCFDGGPWKNKSGWASFWQAAHRDLLRDASTPVLNYFIYALLLKKEDPIAFLDKTTPEEERDKVLAGERNLWCSAVFPFVADRKYVLRDDNCISVPASEVRESDKVTEIFDFQPVKVHVDGTGKETFSDDIDTPLVNRFRIKNMENYSREMTSVTRELIKELE